MLSKFHRFYYKEDEGTPAATETTTAEDPVDDHLNDDPLDFGEEDIDDMTNDSPIVSTAQSEETEETPAEDPKAEETKEETKEEETPSDEKSEEPKAEESEETKPTTFKIGENEYDEPRLAAIIKEHGDMEAWEENLRNLSHLKNMDPEVAKALVPFVHSQKEIPKGLVDKPIMTSVVEALKDFKLEVPYEDLDGKPATLEVTMDQLKPLIEKAVETTTMAHKPELDKSAALTEKVRRDRMNEMVTNFVEADGMNEIFKFHKGKGVDLIDHIDNVLSTPGHPDLVAVKRLSAVVNQIDHKEIKNLDDAYKFLYPNGDSASIAGLIKNQKKGTGITRGTETKTSKDDDDMDIDQNTAEDTLKGLGI